MFANPTKLPSASHIVILPCRVVWWWCLQLKAVENAITIQSEDDDGMSSLENEERKLFLMLRLHSYVCIFRIAVAAAAPAAAADDISALDQ